MLPLLTWKMKNYLSILIVLLMFGLLIVGCGNHHSEQTYDEMLNDVVQNFNKGIIGGDSVLKNFVKESKSRFSCSEIFQLCNERRNDAQPYF